MEENKVIETAAEPQETMEDYKEELEKSYRKIRPGDILTGTVIDVNEKEVTVDFEYSAPGKIPAKEMSNDPAFAVLENVKVGDSITAAVVRTDDGAGNMVLSRRQADNTLAWERLNTAKDEKTVFTAKVSSVVKGGLVIYVEGIRGFMPASRVSTSFVEDLSVYADQEISFRVTEVSEADKKVILSAREVLREQAQEARKEKMAKYAVGAELEGTVETIKDYGAFIKFDDGVSGLLHVSQISDKRIKHPSVVLKEGETVKVRIIKVENGRISLTMKADAEAAQRDAEDGLPREYSEKVKISTGLGDLLKGIKL